MYGVLKVTRKGIDFIENPHPITLSKDHDYRKLIEESDDEDPQVQLFAPPTMRHCLTNLKVLRKKIAKEKNFPHTLSSRILPWKKWQRLTLPPKKNFRR